MSNTQQRHLTVKLHVVLAGLASICIASTAIMAQSPTTRYVVDTKPDILAKGTGGNVTVDVNGDGRPDMLVSYLGWGAVAAGPVSPDVAINVGGGVVRPKGACSRAWPLLL